MNEFKYQFVNFILLALLGAGIYWAFTTIDNSIVYEQNLNETEISSTEEESDVDTEALFDNTKNNSDNADGSVQEVASVTETVVSDNNEPTESNLSAEEEALLGKLQGLIDDNIQMKKGSRGTRVGTVQKFLNIYLDKQSGVDNVYGEGTIKRVKEFQSKEGIGADGFAGPNTYKKMIEVLKK